MKEYRIDMKVRNNLILSKIEEAGYSSVLSFCKATRINYSRLNDFVSMRRPIYDAHGDIRKSVIRVCEELNCTPDEIFSASQMESCLKTNKRTLKVNEAEVIFMLEQCDNQKLLEDNYSDDQMCRAIDKSLSYLTPRERKVIEMRMGMGDHTTPLTFEECAKETGVTRERIRQIEAKALRKMRNPERNGDLKQFLRE